MKAERKIFTREFKLVLLSLFVLLICFVLSFMLRRAWSAELHFLFENPYPHKTLFEEVGSGSATGSGISSATDFYLNAPTIATSTVLISTES